MFFFSLYKVYRKTFFLFVRKMTKKGQNKSPVILTKIKALIFVQERSWNLLWRRRWSPQFISTTNYILTSVCSAQCFSAASRPKVHLEGTKPSVHLNCDPSELPAAIFGSRPASWETLTCCRLRGGATLTLRRKQTWSQDVPVKCQKMRLCLNLWRWPDIYCDWISGQTSRRRLINC